MKTATAGNKRCAIYTRKSSEEGLDQDFNSLDAQREACEAYIKSQTGEGWRLIPAHYDDGGFSGGSMERPGLERLLADIQEQKVDVVVVYKVDRLTRSLADFAKIVEVFDAAGVSFVSVTQQFNTTTSMGRLTLNMLLSFAQFEREVTGERIRDKIAASKKKGMWMGGFVPLGYEASGRSLSVKIGEAKTVRAVFNAYLELGNVRLVKRRADALGLKTKIRKKDDGAESGGRPFSRGYIYKLLSNPIYIGRIPHKGESYDGLHEAIIDQETWDAVQQKLSANAADRRTGTFKSEPSPLIGKLFAEDGQTLTPTHATSAGRRYRYYVSKHNGPDMTAPHTAGWRLAANEIEQSVAAGVRGLMDNPSVFAEATASAGIPIAKVAPRLESLATFSCDPFGIVVRVDLHPDQFVLHLNLEPLFKEPVPTVCHAVPMELRRRGIETRLVIDNGAPERLPDPALVKALARANDWWDRLVSGRVPSMKALADKDGITTRYIRDLLPLAFLSPNIVEAILSGRQPPNLCLADLTRARHLPFQWAEQERMLGFE